VKIEGTVSRANEGFNVNFTNEDLWFTAKANNVYVMSLVAPKANKVVIRSMASMEKEIEEIGLLGCEEQLGWKRADGAVEVELPRELDFSLERGFVLRVSVRDR
jgi:alpha-L-fucosidase